MKIGVMYKRNFDFKFIATLISLFIVLLNVDALRAVQTSGTCLLRAGPFLFRANTVREEGT